MIRFSLSVHKEGDENRDNNNVKGAKRGERHRDRGAEGQIGSQITKKENGKQPLNKKKNYCCTTDSKKQKKKKFEKKEGTKG